MSSLRAKLFLSMGAILLFVGCMSYFLPELLIRKELKKAASTLTERFDKIQNRLLEVASFLITYEVVNRATAYDQASLMISQLANKTKEEDPWKLGSMIAATDPEISFVEIHKQKVVYTITIDGPTYQPQWAREKEGLYLYLREKNETFLALPMSLEKEEPFYLLYPSSSPTLSWSAFGSPEAAKITLKESPPELYQDLLQQKTSWIATVTMIQKLAEHKEALGIAKIDPYFKTGSLILKEEFFSNKTSISPNSSFQQILKRDEKNLDLAYGFFQEGVFYGLGFSLSTLLEQIAQLVQKPLVLFENQKPLLGISKEGKVFDLDQITFSEKMITYNGVPYIPRVIDLNKLSLMILVPQEEATSLDRFFASLKNQLVKEITTNLLAAALLSFVIALLFLSRISKRMTHPITKLAKASEELGRGEYKKIILPDVGKRKDEVAILTRSFGGMVEALKEREKIRGVLNKVVSKEIAEEILRHPLELRGEERQATILFSDIRGFTSLSQHLPPREVIELLNDYLTTMCRIIDDTKGVIDKFVGDEIMAIYGAPLALENSPLHALKAAVAMRSALYLWNEKQKLKGKPTFEMGTGIHFGQVYAGNMGGENRQNYTVIGANVNLASRLCSKAKPMQILITEEVANAPHVRETFPILPLGPIELKGIEAKVQVFEVEKL